MHGGVVSAAKEREISARKKFMVFEAVEGRAPSKSIVDTRRALTWKWLAAKKSAKGR